MTECSYVGSCSDSEYFMDLNSVPPGNIFLKDDNNK
jgi:hypothetical protein